MYSEWCSVRPDLALTSHVCCLLLLSIHFQSLNKAQTGLNQTRSDQTRPDKTRQNKTWPNQTRLDKNRPDLTWPIQTKPNEKKPNQPKTYPNPINPNHNKVYFVFFRFFNHVSKSWGCWYNGDLRIQILDHRQMQFRDSTNAPWLPMRPPQRVTS